MTRGGSELELVEVRRSDRPTYPFAQVTDVDGCLGITWVVPAHLDAVPLVLDKRGYEKAYVDVPRMEDRCYSVTLSAEGSFSSTVVSVSSENCECEILAGENLWLER